MEKMRKLSKVNGVEKSCDNLVKRSVRETRKMRKSA